VGDQHLLVANQYDPTTGRVDIEYTFVSNGRLEIRRGSHRALTYRQLVELLEDTGFTVELAQPWARDAHLLTFIATRGGKSDQHSRDHVGHVA
jgi:hypothetical protein